MQSDYIDEHTRGSNINSKSYYVNDCLTWVILKLQQNIWFYLNVCCFESRVQKATFLVQW